MDQQLSSLASILDVNIRAPILLVSAILPYLGSKANRIINMLVTPLFMEGDPVAETTDSSSVNSRINSPGLALYSASKAALESLTRTWARELAADYHLTSNAVLVGTTDTPDAPVSESRSATAKLATAEHRLGTTNDVAEVVAWLAGEGSRWVNGDLIGANGGTFML